MSGRAEPEVAALVLRLRANLGESADIEAPVETRGASMEVGRVACHLACAVVFLVALISDLTHGWRATGDDAIIAARASSVFSLHPPLVGQFSQGSGGTGHTFYDLGPLLFWLLAAPVRLDPTHGVLWGSALLCIVGAGIAVEAARAFRGNAGAVAVVLCLAIVASTQSFVVVNPVWNPSVGVVWFIATVATAAAVASGRLKWFPALVVAASVAAQSHLEFAATAVGLVVGGLALGLAQRAGRGLTRWVVVGVGAGVVCWVPTLIQQVTSPSGNIAVAWDWLSGRATMGATFGFQALASVAGPRPLWLSPQNRGSDAGALFGLLSHIFDRSLIFGVSVLVVLVVVAVGAWRWRRRDLAALAILTLIAASVTVWTFSSLPQESLLTIVYADVVLWPVGMLVWIVWLWTATAIIVAGWRRYRQNPWMARRVLSLRRREREGGKSSIDAAVVRPSTRWWPWIRTRSGWLMAIGIMSVGIISATLAASTVSDPHLGVPGGWSAVDIVPRAAATVERVTPRGPIALYVDSSNSDVAYSVSYGVIWQLRQDGRVVTATDPHWQPLGPNAAPAPTATRLTLRIRDGGTVTATTDPPR